MDDFDDFLNQLPNPGPPPVSSYQNNNLGDDLDALLGEMENFQVPPVSQPQNNFASSFQPQQIYSNSQSNDLDDLLGQLSSPVSVPTRTTTTVTTTVSTTTTSLDDELDELMNLTEPDRKPPQVPPVTQTPVEDLDDLMNQMGTPVQPQGRTLTRQPSGVRIRSVINQQAKNQSSASPSPPPQNDDVSSLINQFNTPPVAANPRPLPNAPINPPPVAANPRPLAKVNNSPAPKVHTPPPADDLDDLMNQFNTPAPVAPQNSRSAPKFNAPPPTNDLDDLMNQLSVSTPAPVSQNTRAAPKVHTPPPTNDLDDLMNQLSVGTPAPVAPQSSRGAPKVSAPPTNDLDDLMNQLNVGAPSQFNSAPVSAPNARPVSKVNTPPSRASQAPSSDLDDLMNEFNIPPTPRSSVNVSHQTTTTTTTYTPPPVGDDLDELMNSLSTTKPSAQLQQTQQFQSSYQSPQVNSYQQPSVQRTSVTTVQQTRTASPSHNSTSELDDLLSSLETPTSVPKNNTISHVQTTQTQVRAGNSPSLGNSLDDLDSLMAGLNSPTAPVGGMRGSVPNANQMNRMASPQNNRPVSTFGAPGSPGRGQTPVGNPVGAGPGQFGRGQPVNNFGSPSVGAAPGQFGRGQPPVNNFGSPSANPGLGRGIPPQQNSPFNSGGRGVAPPSGGRGVGSPNVGGRGRGFGADPNQLDQLLGSLSNQMNNIKDIEASKGVCHFCQKYIYAECIQAMGRVYHPDHFVCSSCQKPLGTSSFYETNGEPNCESCYQNMFCPRCAYCNQAIADRCINALNQKWHVNCFVCNSCCQPFASGSFFEKGGMPYCQGCFQGTFSSKCAGCGNMASGQLINALGQKWHSQCFCCSYCRRPFNGLPYFEKDGKPYCEQHYHTSAGSVCAGCRTAIVGRCVDALGQKWHPEHFVCSYCMNPLSGGGYTEQHGSPYCQECFANLF